MGVWAVLGAGSFFVGFLFLISAISQSDTALARKYNWPKKSVKRYIRRMAEREWEKDTTSKLEDVENRIRFLLSLKGVTLLELHSSGFTLPDIYQGSLHDDRPLAHLPA